MNRLVAVAVLAFVAFSARPALAATPPLKSLVVHPTDVSNVFGTPFKTHRQNALAAQDLQFIGLLGIFTAGGKDWVAGYTSAFGSPVTPLQSGVNLVVSSVSRYSTAASPYTSVNLIIDSRATLVAQMRAFGVKDLQIVRVHGVGDTAVMATSTLVAKKKTMTTLHVVFVRGRFGGTVDLYGTGTLSKHQAMSLALLMDRRLQHAT